MISQATAGRIGPASEHDNDLGFPTGSSAGVASSPTGGVTLHEVLAILFKRRAAVVAAVIAGLALALIVSLAMVPQYRTSATLEIGDESARLVELGGESAIPVADSQFLDTQLALLRSQSLAERVVRELKLADNPDFADQEASPQDRLDQAAAKLVLDVLIEPVSESRLVRVGYQSSDPDLTARVSNAYASNFITSNIERRYNANDYARDFLQRRILEVRGRLEDSERKLVLYAQRQNIVSVGNQDAEGSEGTAGQSLQSASLGAANSELAIAQNARVAAENRYREAARSASTSEIQQSPSVQSMKTQLAQLRSNYAQKRNELKPDHPEMRELQSGINSLERDIVRERGATVAALQAEYRAASARERELRERVGTLTSDVLNLRGRTIQYNILQRDVDTNRQLYDALLQRFKEVGVSGGIEKNLISIVDVAKKPGAPFKPDIPRNILLGGILGLVGGMGLVIASGLFLNKIKLSDDIARQLSIPALGVIPLERNHTVEDALETPKEPLFEAYAALRSQILFASKHNGLRSLMVTSASPGEGKTTTSLALAQNFARMGKKTVLVDADLRHPSFFARSSSPGLASVLDGTASVAEAVLSTENDGLYLLPAGITPANPADLLINGSLQGVFEELQDQFDMVIVDGPPVLGLVDAPLLSSVVEGTLLVFQSDGVRVPSARNAVERLRSSNAKIIGGVLTMFQGTGVDDSYGYHYDYGADRTDKARIRVATLGPAQNGDARAEPSAASRYVTDRADVLRKSAGQHSFLTLAARIVFWLAGATSLYSAMVAGGVTIWGLSDTVQHILAFVSITVLAIIAYPRVPLWGIWTGLVVFGALIEIVQLVPGLGRGPDWRDFMVDAAAVSCVVALAWALKATTSDRR